MWTAANITRLIVGLLKAAIRPIGSLLALWFAKRAGKKEAQNEALEEHVKTVKASNRARLDGERDGLQPRDYRD